MRPIRVTDSVRTHAARPRWLVVYYMLALVSVVALGTTFLLAVRVVRAYADSARASEQWDARRVQLNALAILASQIDTTSRDSPGAGDSASGPRLDAALSRFHQSTAELRGELTALAQPALSADVVASLVSMDSIASVIGAAGAISASAQLDRSLGDLNGLIRRAQSELSTTHAALAQAEIARTSRMRFIVELVAVVALLTVIALTIYGWRIARSAGLAAAERERGIEILRDSESQHRVLNAALTDAERRAQAAREFAESANRLKTEFLANVSHELRTPLNGMLGMLELALETQLTAAQREYLTTAGASAESLLVIINDILDVSLLESGTAVLEQSDFGVRDTVARALEQLVRLGRDKGLDMTVDIAATVPDRLCGDRARLQRMLMSLVDNAVKFTARGSVTVRIVVDSPVTSVAELHVSIRDTGVGIDPALQATVLEAFRQGDNSTTREYGGVGLGLATASAIVKLMKGRLWIESARGAGTTLHAVIPMPLADGRTTPAPMRESKHKTLRVLVAEDNVVNQRVATSLLERDGHTVTIAANGREAVDLMANEDFDLVVMDVQMPELSGIEATQKIREWERKVGGHVPIIALTARAMDGDRDACIAAGMDAYLSKPVRAEELSMTIQQLTGVVRRSSVAHYAPISEKLSDDVFDGDDLLNTVQGDHELVAELAALFTADAPKRIAAIDDAVERRDAAALHGAAHALKGSAMSLTARRVADRAFAIEQLARDGRLDEAAAVVPEVKRELLVLSDRLHTTIGAH